MSALDEREKRLLENLKGKLPADIYALLDNRDSAPQLLKELHRIFNAVEMAQKPDEHPWDLIGFYYRLENRFYEALSIYHGFYNHMLQAQQEAKERFHKGTPLVWISDCYAQLNMPAHAKRSLMLGHCEDSVTLKGDVSPGGTGVYFRLAWGHGLPDIELRRYARETFDMWGKNQSLAMYPEWILQHLDQKWMTEFPSPKEAVVYNANKRYIRHLLSNLGDGTGRTLEILAEYILSCMPGCRTTRRKRSPSTDYDIICSMEGFDIDFRSELGRYFVCECKDWESPADFTAMAKFCRVLDSTKSRFGILFSKKGISGRGRTAFAEHEQLKIFQDRGMVIVVIDQDDIDQVANGANFTNLLRTKYERVRLDIGTPSMDLGDKQ